MSSLPGIAACPEDVLARVQADYDDLSQAGLPDAWETWLLDRYGVDLQSDYAGFPLRNPFGKASGQLSMNAGQVADDVAAGLGFVVLKTVIAQDPDGAQTMRAWAIREARMDVERITGQTGETGWTVTWKGRGWWQSFDDYLRLVRDSRRIAREGQPAGSQPTLVTPSVKYHLPLPGESSWRIAEYDFTTRKLLEAWDASREPMPLEKDFSPTLAGSDRATVRETVLEWLQKVPPLIRTAAGRENVRVGLKLFNALFDDAFQLDMLEAIHRAGDDRPDFYVYGNRLYDPKRVFDGHQGVAYGGPDLSDRNLRVLRQFHNSPVANTSLPWSATGNIDSGRRALEYAILGATSFQMHTFFQLPLDQYRLRTGSRTQRGLFELLLHPLTGFIVNLHAIATERGLDRKPVRFREIAD